MISILNNDKTKSLIKKAGCVLACGVLVFSLTGCFPTEVATNSNIYYDMIDTTSNDALENGITQIKEVPGQPFNLVINYQCELKEDEKWTVSSDKKINMEIRTDGLPAGYEVYIDNVHTDTTICSYFPTIDGVPQDTMDDRIHNAQLMGFPISDSNAYLGINQIEGQNETFIKGFVHGYNGSSVHGSISENRRVESDYLAGGVFANKITSIIDLIIINGEEITCVSVPSEVQVSVWPFIKMIDEDGTIFYRYYFLGDDGLMTYEELTEDEYLVRTQVEGLKKEK